MREHAFSSSNNYRRHVEIEIVVDPEKVRPVETPYLCADNTRVKKYWNGTDIRTTLKKMFDHFKAEA